MRSQGGPEMTTRPEIEEVLRDHSQNYQSIQWSEVKAESEVLRVDALAYAKDKTHPGSSVFLFVDRVEGDSAYASTIEDVSREVLFTRASIERYPSLEGGDNYLYFVPRTKRK